LIALSKLWYCQYKKNVLLVDGSQVTVFCHRQTRSGSHARWLIAKCRCRCQIHVMVHPNDRPYDLALN
jgi:hypothetical protein